MTNAERGSRSIKLAGLTAAAAFGPYLSGRGVRPEQLLIYGSLGFLLPTMWLRLKLTRQSAVILALLGSVLVIGVLGAIFPPPATLSLLPSSLLAVGENLASPLAAILLTQAWLASGAPREALLRVITIVIVTGASANALLALASTRLELTPFLVPFWTGGGGSSVGEQVTALGRQAGIYNQPAEAGLFYGIAFLAAVYRLRSRPVWLAVTSLLIILGGILAVSKVFILIGFPIGVWQLLRLTKGRQRRLISLLMAAIGAAMAGQAGVLSQWEGSRRLERLLNPNGSFLQFYTAGRFGLEGGVSTGIRDILQLSPWFGLGATGRLQLAYDSTWLEVMAVAGIVGLVLTIFTFGALAYAWVCRRQIQPESALGGGLLLLALGASFGLPALTANRAGSFLWLLLTLTLLTDARRTPQDPIQSGVAPLEGPSRVPVGGGVVLLRRRRHPSRGMGTGPGPGRA